MQIHRLLQCVSKSRRKVRQRLRNHPEPAAALPFPHSNFRARGCSRTPEPCTAHTRKRSVPSARWPFRTEMRPKGPSGTKSRSRRASAQPGRTAGKRPAEGSGGDRKRETGTAETGLRKGSPPEEAMPGPACFHFGYQRYDFSARCGMFRTFNHIELIINKISLQSHAVFPVSCRRTVSTISSCNNLSATRSYG